MSRKSSGDGLQAKGRGPHGGYQLKFSIEWRSKSFDRSRFSEARIDRGGPLAKNLQTEVFYLERGTTVKAFSVAGQSTFIVLVIQTTAMFFIPTFKRSARLAYIEVVAEVATEPIYKETIRARITVGKMVTRVAIMVLNFYLSWFEAIF